MLLLIIYQVQRYWFYKGTKPGSDDEIEMKFDDNAPFSALGF